MSPGRRRVGVRVGGSSRCGLGRSLRRRDPGIRLGAGRRLGVAQLDLFEERETRGLLLREGLTHRLVGETLLFDLAEALHLGLGVVLQLGEHRLLVLDRLLLSCEFLPLLGESPRRPGTRRSSWCRRS